MWFRHGSSFFAKTKKPSSFMLHASTTQKVKTTNRLCSDDGQALQYHVPHQPQQAFLAFTLPITT